MHKSNSSHLLANFFFYRESCIENFHKCTYLELIGDSLSLAMNRGWVNNDEFIFSAEYLIQYNDATKYGTLLCCQNYFWIILLISLMNLFWEIAQA